MHCTRAHGTVSFAPFGLGHRVDKSARPALVSCHHVMGYPENDMKRHNWLIQNKLTSVRSHDTALSCRRCQPRATALPRGRTVNGRQGCLRQCQFSITLGNGLHCACKFCTHTAVALHWRRLIEKLHLFALSPLYERISQNTCSRALRHTTSWTYAALGRKRITKNPGFLKILGKIRRSPADSEPIMFAAGCSAMTGFSP